MTDGDGGGSGGAKGGGAVTGQWTDAEHAQFRKAVVLHGWGRWLEVRPHVPTRTVVQIRCHAQKLRKNYRGEYRELEALHKELSKWQGAPAEKSATARELAAKAAAASRKRKSEAERRKSEAERIMAARIVAGYGYDLSAGRQKSAAAPSPRRRCSDGLAGRAEAARKASKGPKEEEVEASHFERRSRPEEGKADEARAPEWRDAPGGAAGVPAVAGDDRRRRRRRGGRRSRREAEAARIEAARAAAGYEYDAAVARLESEAVARLRRLVESAGATVAEAEAPARRPPPHRRGSDLADPAEVARRASKGPKLEEAETPNLERRARPEEGGVDEAKAAELPDATTTATPPEPLAHAVDDLRALQAVSPDLVYSLLAMHNQL